VEVLSKRPRFAKSQKKQALGAFAAAVEAIFKCQEAEVVDQVGEGRIREGRLALLSHMVLIVDTHA